jgi:microcin C transport system substrate-binding protein
VRFLILLLSLTFFARAAAAQNAPEVRPQHGFTVLGEPALPPDFKAFPYVNVNAPKGGEVHLAEVGSFDSFNPFILRGTSELHGAAPWITLPGGSGSGSTSGHVWESLLTPSANEIATGYCHLAESI